MRFFVVKKPDASLIVASYGDVRPPVTIGRYADKSEAMEALANLSQSLNDGYAPRMKSSSYGGIENKAENYHGKKEKGHGGS